MAKKQAHKKSRHRRTRQTAPHRSDPRRTVLADINRKDLDRRIQKALDLLERTTAGRPIRVAEIAAALNISPSHLRHLFRQEAGTSPTHYRRLLRLRKAKELLETSFLSVKEVMLAVGFKDESHFVRDFKAVYGKRPTQVRTSAERRPGPAHNSGQ